MCNSRSACIDYILYTRLCSFSIEYEIIPTLKEFTLKESRAMTGHVNEVSVIGAII